jgi:iron only hydrogenase large subunit-like protein
MPCYDKKLEAVRPEFGYSTEESKTSVKEIDTVLASHELLELFKAKGIEFNKIKVEDETNPTLGDDPLSIIIAQSQTFSAFTIHTLFARTSNGYLEYVFRRAAKDLFSVDIAPHQKLVYTQGKNRHY